MAANRRVFSPTPEWYALTRVFRSSAGFLALPLLPSECRLCEAPMDGVGPVPVCSPCLKAIRPQQHNHLCLRCATRLDPDAFASAQDKLCEECRERPPAFESVLAYGEYAGELRELIHLLKFGGIVSIAELLAAEMSAMLLCRQHALPQPLIITAVPLFSRKQSARGFNQARILAAELSKGLRAAGWDVSENYRLLYRKRATRSQTELNLRQRRANLRGVFSPAGGITAAEGANILLVDDIVTTGATARQCAAVLKKSGAAHVWVAAAARSQREDTARWDGRVQ